ncbi:MAG: guanylate kinase [Salinisphaera sp.]|nr:guanylate kinase [Salinisphaera sp.]
MATPDLRGRLVVVAAPSGAGKTSLTHAVIRRLDAAGRGPCFSVSYTTRAPRAGERDGFDYHFISEARYAQMVAQNLFLEHARVYDHGYGTGRQQTERLLAAGRSVILDIDWQGARLIRANAPDSVSIFIMPPSRAELERRLRARALDDDATIARRLAQADEDLAHASEFDHRIVNEDFDAAVAALETIIAAPAGQTPSGAQ